MSTSPYLAVAGGCDVRPAHDAFWEVRREERRRQRLQEGLELDHRLLVRPTIRRERHAIAVVVIEKKNTLLS